MMFCRILILCLVSVAFMGRAGDQEKIPATVEAKAVYCTKPIVLDGKLDEKAWKTAPAYTFHSQIESEPMRQNGSVKFLWDDKFLYVGGVFEDDDIVQNKLTDQEHHYRFGDVMELFIRPPGDTLYWELYSTPNGNRTSFLILGGRSMIGGAKDIVMKNLKVASKLDGSLNNWRDKDRKWTTEMAIPLDELVLNGKKIKPGDVWRFFITRINFTRYSRFKEVSCIGNYSPKIITAHHGQDYWGKLEFVKTAANAARQN